MQVPVAVARSIQLNVRSIRTVMPLRKIRTAMLPPAKIVRPAAMCTPVIPIQPQVAIQQALTAQQALAAQQAANVQPAPDAERMLPVQQDATA